MGSRLQWSRQEKPGLSNRHAKKRGQDWQETQDVRGRTCNEGGIHPGRHPQGEARQRFSISRDTRKVSGLSKGK